MSIITGKLIFEGKIISVQPRIRLTRSFDERTHNYLGYALQLNGIIDSVERQFSIGIGKDTQKKHEFRVGDQITGECVYVSEPDLEPVEFYKVSRLKKISQLQKVSDNKNAPPWEGISLSLEEYRERGHRRLSAQTYETKCKTCMWGCRMSVEIIIDHWNPSKRKYRYETFCYGPKSCRFYKAGPMRKVPERNGMVWEEEDWIDEQDTEHREDDE